MSANLLAGVEPTFPKPSYVSVEDGVITVLPIDGTWNHFAVWKVSLDARTDNKTMHASVSAKWHGAAATKGSVYASVSYSDAAGKQNTVNSFTNSITAEWQRLEFTFDIPSGMAIIDFHLGMNNLDAACDFSSPAMSYDSPVTLAVATHTPYATQEYVDAEKADVSAIVPKASVESSTTASQAYAAGQYVVVNGILRKVKSAIAKGNAISDSNSSATTVGGELATIGDSVSKQQAANKYSTSETDTGRTWIDGKKIYRRVVNLGHFSSGETRKSIGFSYDNIVSAVFLSGDSDGETGSQMPSYPNDTYWRADATLAGTEVVVRIGASFSGCYITGVFEYTK